MTRKVSFFHTLKGLSIGTAICLSPLASNAQFSFGNVVVLQVGDGVQTLANTGNTLILKEFTNTGTPAFSVTIPDNGLNSLIGSGTATSEGLITLAADGNSIILPGYNISRPYSSSVSGATSVAVPRGIGQVDAAGNFTLPVSSTTAFSANNIRSAVSDGLGNYWASGANTGIAYFGTGTPATVFSTPTNNRSLQIFQGNLLYSTGSGTKGIYGGLGMPVTASISANILTTPGSTSPFCFAINNMNDTIYISDDGGFVGTGTQAGGIQKYYYNGSAWVFMYTLQCGNASMVGARGLIADFSGPHPVLYATTAEGTNNRLIKITDMGANSGSSATLLATAPTGAIFRGVCFSPGACVPPSITAILPDTTVCEGTNLTFSVTATGSPSNYSWLGPNGFAPNLQNPSITSITNAASGNYYAYVTNACGNATDGVLVNVNPILTPSIVISEIPIIGPNLATGGTASASDYYISAPNLPAHAFDGDTATSGWGNEGNALPSWLEYDFGSGNAKVIKAYSFFCSSNQTGGWGGDQYGPMDWSFEGFNGLSWDTLDLHKTTGVNDDQWYTFSFSNTVPYEKYRIQISNTIDGDYTFITELKLSDTSWYAKCEEKNFLAELTSGPIPFLSGDWLVNGVSAGVNNEIFPLPSFSLHDTVSALITTTYACVTQSTANSNQIILTTGPNDSVNNVSLCAGQTVTIGSNIYSSPGSYTDVLINTFGCDSTVYTNITVDTINLTTNTVSNTITANATGASYQWIDCNSGLPIVGATNQSYTATMNGDYAVIVTLGCSDTSACVNINSIGIHSLGSNTAIVKVYPNPNNGNFTVKSNIDETFQLVNSLGQYIQTFELNSVNNHEIIISALEIGVYYILGKNGLSYSKIVVTK